MINNQLIYWEITKKNFDRTVPHPSRKIFCKSCYSSLRYFKFHVRRMLILISIKSSNPTNKFQRELYTRPNLLTGHIKTPYFSTPWSLITRQHKEHRLRMLLGVVRDISQEEVIMSLPIYCRWLFSSLYKLIQNTRKNLRPLFEPHGSSFFFLRYSYF